MHWYYEKMSEGVKELKVDRASNFSSRFFIKPPIIIYDKSNSLQGVERSIKNPWNRNSPPILGYILGGK